MVKEFIEHQVTATITIDIHICIEDWEEACEHIKNDFLENGIENYNPQFEFNKGEE